MKRLLVALLTAGLMTACGSGRIGPRNVSIQLGTLIDAATLDAASSTATITGGKLDGYGLLALNFSLTDANDSVTAITMKCASQEASIANKMTACDAAVSGSSTCYEAAWVIDPSGYTVKAWTFRVDVEAIRNAVCTVTDTGGLVADVLTVTGFAAVK